jgi:hypothetical protein
MLVYLKRQDDNGKATIGTFFFETEETQVNLGSLELPWKDNQQYISCIPKGTYKVKTTFSNRYQKDMWEIMDVPGRGGIRIHSANYASQLLGCIALGLQVIDIDKDGTMDIANSRKAIELAEHHLGKEFELEIL